MTVEEERRWFSAETGKSPEDWLDEERGLDTRDENRLRHWALMLVSLEWLGQRSVCSGDCDEEEDC